MTNVELSIDHEQRLHIVIDLREEPYGMSRSGRNELIASTGGNIRLPGEKGYRKETLNLSLWRQIPKS